MENIVLTQFTVEEFRQIIRDEVASALKGQVGFNEQSDHVSIEEAMRITNLKRQTIYCLVNSKSIPHFKIAGHKKLYFSRHALIQWIESGRKRTVKEINEESQFKNKNNRRSLP